MVAAAATQAASFLTGTKTTPAPPVRRRRLIPA